MVICAQHITRTTQVGLSTGNPALDRRDIHPKVLYVPLALIQSHASAGPDFLSII
jgi:hypothetical protein